MGNGVNGEPPPREQARTRLARGAVIDAARFLFVEHGYASTTIEEISHRAGVPQPTLYRLFASKLGILKVLLDVSIAGDDEPVEVLQRPPVASLLDEPDPRRVLTGFAAITAGINRRTNDVYTVLSRAADSDPEAAVLFETLTEQRARGQQRVVHALHRDGRLRAGTTAEAASDIVHALMSPEMYRLLVTDRGWTPERYQLWAADTLAQQLL
jgi:AcrR family transcriptional regulator